MIHINSGSESHNNTGYNNHSNSERMDILIQDIITIQIMGITPIIITISAIINLVDIHKADIITTQILDIAIIVILTIIITQTLGILTI